MFYLEGATSNSYHKKSKLEKWIAKTWQAICLLATYFGNWIESNTKPTRRVDRMTATYRRYRSTSSTKAIWVMSAIMAMQARTAVATERVAQFDTDAEWIGVDNRCTGCISHIKSDFVGPLKQSQRVVKGFGGSTVTNVKIGTLRWTWDDNLGKSHTFDIPNSYYIPDGKVRLLSPQHWAQTQNGNNRDKIKDNCGEGTNVVPPSGAT